MKKMRFDILTIFPDVFDSYVNESIMQRARKKKLLTVKTHDIRKFAKDKHRTVDDSPYGGGPGMVLKPEPIQRGVEATKKLSKKSKKRVVLFSTRGRMFTQKEARRLAKYDQLIFICGRYEGVDERVAKYVADEEISIGDFILSGGEIPALVVMEAVSRHVPGVLGKGESLEEIKGSYPVYTRPEKFEYKQKSKKKTSRVPKVLLSGDHKKIEEWRDKN